LGPVTQRSTEFTATGDAELAVHLAEMGLDRLSRNEQGLRDLGIAVPRGCELCDTALRDGQWPYPGLVRRARPVSGGAEFDAGSLGERSRAAAVGESKAGSEDLSSFRALVCAPQPGAKVDECARMLEPRRRTFEHARGLAEAIHRRCASFG
jgi:hypothetical protein